MVHRDEARVELPKDRTKFTPAERRRGDRLFIGTQLERKVRRESKEPSRVLGFTVTECRIDREAINCLDAD